MLFNSYPFLFIFLPVVLLGYYALADRDWRLAAGWLAAASLAFYSYWNVRYLPLLCGSILINYFIGRGILSAASRKDRRLVRAFVIIGVVFDLSLLGYFKYANFFIVNVNTALGSTFPAPHVILPLGISFFTFTQIAYLVDVSRGSVKEYSFTHYTLFVSYFPHLIAGPILHHRDVIPQFKSEETYRLSHGNIARGLAFFAIGLCKKVILADGIAHYVAPVFDFAARGGHLAFFEAWGGALAYTFQLYFDFSGYSDMAVGLSWLFNVRLPFNFNSPYKATSVVDFWRRWHITLSQWFQDYLYYPLAMRYMRKGGWGSKYKSHIIAMGLIGLWHGANWTFVVFGLYWGFVIALYLYLTSHMQGTNESRVRACLGQALTLLVAVIAWVFFRAPSVTSAFRILSAMFGFNGISLPQASAHGLPGRLISALGHMGVHFAGMGSLFHGATQVSWIVVLLAICLLLPNSQQLIEGAAKGSWITERLVLLRRAPAAYWAAALGIGTAWCISQLGNPTEFLYFQF